MVEHTETCPWCGGTISREQFLKIQARIRQEEKEKAAASEALLRKKLAEQFRQDLEKQRQADKLAVAQAEQKAKNAQAQAVASEAALRKRLAEQFQLELEKQRQADKLATALAEQRVKKELAAQRASLEKNRDELLLKKQAEFNRERERFQKKIMELDRQNQRKSTGELGDGAEIDLFEALREAFPTDRITRIPKGEPGGDILHEVMHRGDSCGRILIDAKNRQSWQNAFIAKLRQDQVTAKAEHAVLSTVVFPSGKKELTIESDVIVVNPARAVHVVSLLRSATIALHLRGLSVKDRTGKMHSLYKLITSDAYTKRFREAGRLAQDILDLDVDEKKTHDNVWKRRGSLATRMHNVLRELDTDIAAIIEADGSSAASVA